MDGSCWWARLGARRLGDAEGRAVGGLTRLGEVVLAPIAAGPRVLAVLTICSATLGRADRSTAELLGRVAGGARAARLARGAGQRDGVALAAAAGAA